MGAEPEALARGVRLQAARKLKGLSQEEAAAQLGVSRVTVSSWENGSEIAEEWIPGIAKLYDVEPAWIRYAAGIAPEGLSIGGRRAEVTTDALVQRDGAGKNRKGA